MLPGKKYTPEDVLRILRKRVWLVLVPFAVVAATTAVVARKWPDSYRSQVLILVVPPRVPENLVKPSVTTRLVDRLQAISQQILSRTQLERIILDLNLYPEERKNGIMEDVVDDMRQNHIKWQVMRGDAFQLSYVGSSPRTVQQVTERLGALFINENKNDRETLAQSTNQFLDTELQNAHRRLIEHEQKLQAYNEKYSGQLPSQLGANLQGAQSTMMQLQQLVESVNSDRQQKLFLERQLKDLEETPAPDPAPSGQPAVDDQGNPIGGSATQQLAAAKAALASYQQRYSDIHPDVVRLKALIRDLGPKAEAEALARPVSQGGLSPAEAARQKKLSDLRTAVDLLDRQIAAKQDDEEKLKNRAAMYQARVEATPSRESDMTELTRDYATLQRQYQSLLQKKEDSQLAANLERAEIGEQFKLLDPAGVPQRPFSPDRPLINAFGLAGGLALGLALVALLEYRDRSFKTDEEVTSVLGLPVLAVVPLMQSAEDRRRVRRRGLLTAVACGSTVVVCLAVVAYTFVR